MNVLKKLSKLSDKLSDLKDELGDILESIPNMELYTELDNRVRDELENAINNLEITITDIEDGIYIEDRINDEDSEDFDFEY